MTAIGLVAAAALGAAVWGRVSDHKSAMAVVAQPADADPAAGAALYAGNCAACHGAMLEGQENWQIPAADGSLRAPPHDVTGHSWHHPDSMLFAYTRRGGKAVMADLEMNFDSGMPGFGDRLSDAEIWNILAFIKTQWPDRQRQAQADRTRAEQER